MIGLGIFTHPIFGINSSAPSVPVEPPSHGSGGFEVGGGQGHFDAEDYLNHKNEITNAYYKSLRKGLEHLDDEIKIIKKKQVKTKSRKTDIASRAELDLEIKLQLELLTEQRNILLKKIDDEEALIVLACCPFVS